MIPPRSERWWRRVEYYAVQAMIAEGQGDTDRADRCRRMVDDCNLFHNGCRAGEQLAAAKSKPDL